MNSTLVSTEMNRHLLLALKQYIGNFSFIESDDKIEITAKTSERCFVCRKHITKHFKIEKRGFFSSFTICCDESENVAMYVEHKNNTRGCCYLCKKTDEDSLSHVITGILNSNKVVIMIRKEKEDCIFFNCFLNDNVRTRTMYDMCKGSNLMFNSDLSFLDFSKENLQEDDILKNMHDKSFEDIKKRMVKSMTQMNDRPNTNVSVLRGLKMCIGTSFNAVTSETKDKAVEAVMDQEFYKCLNRFRYDMNTKTAYHISRDNRMESSNIETIVTYCLKSDFYQWIAGDRIHNETFLKYTNRLRKHPEYYLKAVCLVPEWMFTDVTVDHEMNKTQNDDLPERKKLPCKQFHVPLPTDVKYKDLIVSKLLDLQLESAEEKIRLLNAMNSCLEVQTPGRMLNLIGRTGTGKTTLLSIFGVVLGPLYDIMSKDDRFMFQGFRGKLVVHGKEIHPNDISSCNRDELKWIIDGDNVRVDAKHSSACLVRRFNVLFDSNYSQCKSSRNDDHRTNGFDGRMTTFQFDKKTEELANIKNDFERDIPNFLVYLLTKDFSDVV